LKETLHEFTSEQLKTTAFFTFFLFRIFMLNSASQIFDGWAPTSASEVTTLWRYINLFIIIIIIIIIIFTPGSIDPRG